MDWLNIIFSNIGGVIITTLLLVFLNAMGVLDKLLTLFKKSNGNGYQLQIDELKRHSEIANGEVGKINEKIEKIEIKLASIEGKTDIIIQKML